MQVSLDFGAEHVLREKPVWGSCPVAEPQSVCLLTCHCHTKTEDVTQQTPVHAVSYGKRFAAGLLGFLAHVSQAASGLGPRATDLFLHRLQRLTKAAEINCATKLIHPQTFSTNGGVLSSDFAAWPYEQPGHGHHPWKAQKWQDAKCEPISILSLTGALPTWLSSD